MAYERCSKCGQMHYATDPCRPKAPSKVATDKFLTALSEESRQAINAAISDATIYGEGWTKTTTEGVEHVAPPKRGVGRPKTITDMRAYKAQKERERRERRARLRAEKP